MTYRHKTTETQAKLGEDGKYYIHNCSIGIPKQFIEQNSVWEKVEEVKDYEILSFTAVNGGIWVKIKEDLFKKDYTYMGEETCKAICKIHSVRRLSDGEIFSIGDDTNYRKITKFSIDDQKIKTYKSGIIVYTEIFSYDLCAIEKIKEPILTTEDGVDIFNEDELVWDISTINWDYLDTTPAKYMKDIVKNFNHRKAFSSEISAKKYIKENKKQYSLNDIKETVKKLGCFGTTLIKYLEDDGR